MENLSDFYPLFGGMLIGLSGAILWIFTGRIAGISNIFSGVIHPRKGTTAWQFFFLGGLLVGGGCTYILSPENYAITIDRSLPAFAIAGILVGFGASLANGCTSGHGVCGNSRLSPRSMVATLTFMFTGGVSVWLLNIFFGGRL